MDPLPKEDLRQTANKQTRKKLKSTNNKKKMKTETLVKKTMQKSNVMIKNKSENRGNRHKINKISKSPARH